MAFTWRKFVINFRKIAFINFLILTRNWKFVFLIITTISTKTTQKKLASSPRAFSTNLIQPTTAQNRRKLKISRPKIKISRNKQTKPCTKQKSTSRASRIRATNSNKTKTAKTINLRKQKEILNSPDNRLRCA